MGDPRITLYYDHISYYSQRAYLALVEKGIDYESKIVPVTDMAFIDPWFVKLNPVGKIPIIVHGEKVITETARIVEYLDEVYPDTILLHPKDADEQKQVIYFRDFADSITCHALMAGSVRHPHLVPGPAQFPPGRMEAIIKMCNIDILKKAAQLGKEHPEMRMTYEKLIQNREQNRWDLISESEFGETLSRADRLMSEVEDQLKATQKQFPQGDSFLCGKTISSADIFLIILMHRLKQYGLAKRFWGNGQRPLVSAYYEWMIKRPNCAKVLPFFNIK